MTKNGPPDGVTDLFHHNSSSKEKISCCNIYNIDHEREFLILCSFLLKSRLGVNHNLKLFYFLAYSQIVSLKSASGVLKISRPLIYNRILPDNPCFLSELRTRSGWGKGGPQRMIILSKQAKEYQKIITKLAILHLGENECQRLETEG
jgi:hypothetical protein